MVFLREGACALGSEAADEPLAGTAATDGEVYFLLRYPGSWAPKALEGSDLPDAIKAQLLAAAKATRGRVLLFRGPDRRDESPELLVVRTRHGSRFALRFRLTSYADLLGIDLVAAATDGAHPDAEEVVGPLALVCVHGRRDACCAARGTALHHELAPLMPGRVLMVSHLGGHRFSAVVVSLPDGHCYGRVDPSEASALAEAITQGRIFDVERLRGRTSVDQPSQAAEVFARRASGLDGIDDVRALSATPLEAHAFRITLSVQGRTEERVVRREGLPTLRAESCGAAPSPAYRFR